MAKNAVSSNRLRGGFRCREDGNFRLRTGIKSAETGMFGDSRKSAQTGAAVSMAPGLAQAT
jgi:hypothetical protein